VQAGLQGRNGIPGPRTWACPTCTYRALHPDGHAVCMGNEAMTDIEARQALLIVAAGPMFQEEEVA